MAFLAYFDASGSGVDPAAKVLSAGGFVAHESVWLSLERRWPEMLSQFGISELHMKDYAHSRGEFAGWNTDQEKRRAFMMAVTKEINEHDLRFFGASVALSVHRAYNRHYCVEETIGAPYTVAMVMAMARMSAWQQRRITEPILLHIEKGDNQQGDLRRYFARIVWDDGMLPEPTFRAKKWTDGSDRVQHMYPFQLADFIVYEQGKALSDFLQTQKRQARQSLLQVVRPVEEAVEGRTYWALLERRTYGNFLKNFAVPQRFNRFQGKLTSRRRRLIYPLTYLGDMPIVGIYGADAFIKDPEA